MAVIHHWPLTINAIDIIGGIPTTNNGAVVFSVDNGASLNGSNQWLSFIKSISLTTVFSVSAWVKFNNVSLNAAVFSNDAAGIGASMAYSAGKSSISYAGQSYEIGSNDFNSSNYPTNRHVLCTMTCNGNKLLRLYRDNVLVGQQLFGGVNQITADYWAIGRSGSRSSYYLSGYILDAQFDDAERSQEEVTSIFAGGPNAGSIYSPIFVGG
jgi:hypothetical protein